MFEFCGKLSKECEDFLYNKQKKLDFISVCVVCIIFSIIVVALSILLHPIILLFFLLIAFMLAIPFLSITKKGFLEHMPNRITFNLNEDTLIYRSNKGENFYMISDIEKIYDYGNFYHIKFKGVPDSYYVLQKDLITQGTIDNFVEYFKDKICVAEK